MASEESGPGAEPSVSVSDSEYVAVAQGAGAQASVTIYGTPPVIDYTAKMRDDVALALSLLESKNVLTAQFDNEIWRYVFESLRGLRDALATTAAQLRTRGPGDVKAVVQFMVKAVAAYLAEHEADYVRYMSSHGGWEPGWAHVERDWLLSTKGAAADHLVALREVLARAMHNLSVYADTGETIEWEPASIAQYWSDWAKSELANRHEAGGA
jgi:hypothetical protein